MTFLLIKRHIIWLVHIKRATLTSNRLLKKLNKDISGRGSQQNCFGKFSCRTVLVEPIELPGLTNRLLDIYD